MSALKNIIGAAGKLFVKKVTTYDAEGDEQTKTRAREGVKGAGWIIGFLLFWHFILQPVLAHYLPECEFPALDCG